MNTGDNNKYGDSEGEDTTIFHMGEDTPDSVYPPWVKLRARQEDKRWESLDDIRLSNDSRWLRVYGWLVLLLTVMFALSFLAAFLIWGLHYTGKSEWLWLKDSQLDKIQSVLFSGGMGAIISGIIRAQLAKTKAN